MPYNTSAPCSPTALGRWKIQFCQAERREKILDSIVSGPGKRRLASNPVNASGEKLARDLQDLGTSAQVLLSEDIETTGTRLEDRR